MCVALGFVAVLAHIDAVDGVFHRYNIVQPESHNCKYTRVDTQMHHKRGKPMSKHQNFSQGTREKKTPGDRANLSQREIPLGREKVAALAESYTSPSNRCGNTYGRRLNMERNVLHR